MQEVHNYRRVLSQMMIPGGAFRNKRGSAGLYVGKKSECDMMHSYALRFQLEDRAEICVSS